MSVLPSTVFIGEVYGLITGDTPHLALYTSNPGAGNTGTEVAGGSYARKPITFGAISGSTISNSAALTFSNMPTSTVTHWGILDALTGGNLKIYGALDGTVGSVTGDEIIFPIGNLTINLAGN